MIIGRCVSCENSHLKNSRRVYSFHPVQPNLLQGPFPQWLYSRVKFWMLWRKKQAKVYLFSLDQGRVEERKRKMKFKINKSCWCFFWMQSSSRLLNKMSQVLNSSLKCEALSSLGDNLWWSQTDTSSQIIWVLFWERSIKVWLGHISRPSQIQREWGLLLDLSLWK